MAVTRQLPGTHTIGAEPLSGNGVYWLFDTHLPEEGESVHAVMTVTGAESASKMTWALHNWLLIPLHVTYIPRLSEKNRSEVVDRIPFINRPGVTQSVVYGIDEIDEGGQIDFMHLEANWGPTDFPVAQSLGQTVTPITVDVAGYDYVATTGILADPDKFPNVFPIDVH